MILGQFSKRVSSFLGVFWVIVLILGAGCQTEKEHKTAATATPDLTARLGPGASIETIASHLLQVRKEVGTTRALALYYPKLDEKTAYTIQMTLLSMLEKQGERVAGWKMGGSQVTDSSQPFHPVFGFMLASYECPSGGTANSSRFVDGSPLVEAEVGFTFKEDLPGPTVSRQELLAAIDSVGGFSELISIRVRDAKGGTKATLPQAIADGLANGGFIQPKHKRAWKKFNPNQVVTAEVLINGQVKASGDSKGFAFIDALLYLANSLPQYGRHLRAGDIVITGSVLKPPPAKAGDHVEIKFSEFEPLRITFK
ncbi:MAG: hypothetical protein GXO76_02410 [Calditrichaeota bacterium]|nr:hypothetical protein [Calditrichota bacterium]